MLQVILLLFEKRVFIPLGPAKAVQVLFCSLQWIATFGICQVNETQLEANSKIGLNHCQLWSPGSHNMRCSSENPQGALGELNQFAGPSASLSWIFAGATCLLSGFAYMELSAASLDQESKKMHDTLWSSSNFDSFCITRLACRQRILFDLC